MRYSNLLNKKLGLDNPRRSAVTIVTVFTAVTLFTGGVASQNFSDLRITDTERNFRIENSQDSSNWTIKFNSTLRGTLKVEEIKSARDISNVRIYQYRDGSYVQKAASVTGNKVTTSWNGEKYPGGKIVYQVDGFEVFRANITLSGVSETIQSPGRIRRDSQNNIFNLRDGIVPSFKTCSFESEFWLCDPQPDEPGYSGEVIDLKTERKKKIEVPKNSTLTRFSVDLRSVENNSVESFDGQGVVFSDISGDKDGEENKEIITFSGREIKAYRSNGESIWNYTTQFAVNDLGTSNSNISNSNSEIIVATENALILLSPQGEKIWRESGFENFDVASGELSSDKNRYALDDGNAEDLIRINSGEDEARFEIPYSIENKDGTVFVESALNFRGSKSGNLKFGLGGENYSVDTGQVRESAVFNLKRGTGSIDDIVKIDNNSTVEAESFVPDFEAKNVYLNLPLAKTGTGGNLEIELNGRNYSLDSSRVKQINIDTDSSGSTPTNVSEISSNNQATITSQFNPSRNTSVYLGGQFTRKGGEDDNIRVEVGGEPYSIDTEQVKSSNLKQFNGDDGVAEDSFQISNNTNATFNLHYDIPQNIEAETVYLRTALNFFGDKSGDLSLELNGQSYDLDERQINESSKVTTALNDGSREESLKLLGSTETTSRIVPNFNLDALNVSSLESQSLSISAPFCYVGNKSNIQEVLVSGGGIDRSPKDLNTSSIPECSSGSYEYTSTTFDRQDVSSGFVEFRCTNCTNQNFYRIAGDDSTNDPSYVGGNADEETSNFENGSSSEIVQSAPFDFMVNVSTDSSLESSFVETEVPVSEINQGDNVTISCDGCSEKNNYGLLSDDSSSGNSFYYNGTDQRQISSDFMVRVFSNTSLDGDFAYTRVDPEDIKTGTNITFKCPTSTCKEGYGIMSDSSASGTSYINGEQIPGSLMLQLEKRPLNFSFEKIKVDKSEFVNSNKIKIYKTGAGSNKFYLGLDNSSDLSTDIIKSEYSVNKDFGSGVRVFSNSSLDYSEVRTEINGTSYDQGQNLTYFCDGCESNSEYNILVDNSTSGNSYFDSGQGFSQISGNLMSRAESYGSNVGEEIVASRFPTVVEAYNSTSGNLWEYQADRQIFTVETGDVSARTGNETVVGTAEKIIIISSTGKLEQSYPSESSKFKRFRDITLSNITTDQGKEIIAGTDSGELVAVDSGGNRIWKRQISNNPRVQSVSSGNVAKYPGTEIIVGLDSGKILIIDEQNGEIQTSYTRNSGITELENGVTLSQDSNEELGISLGSSRNTEILDLYQVPEDVKLNVNDGDGSAEYSKTGLLSGYKTIDNEDIVDSFQTQIDGCEAGRCNVSFNLSSSSKGSAQLINPRLKFEYNDSSTYSVNNSVTSWAKVDGIRAGESIKYAPIKINYSESPEVLTQVGSLANPTPEVVNFGQISEGDDISFNRINFDSGTDSAIILPSYLRYFRTSLGEPRDSDYIWFNQEKSAKPVTVEKSGIIEPQPFFKNVTVKRNTSKTDDVFNNVTVEIDVSESEIKGEKSLRVDWNNSGEYTDITPDEFGCSSYKDFSVDGAKFKVCKLDKDNNGSTDGFRWIQPNVTKKGTEHAETTYRMGVLENNRPILENLTVSPRRIKWGDDVEVNVSFSDIEDDDINTSLWAQVSNEYIKKRNSFLESKNNVSYKIGTFRNWTGGPNQDRKTPRFKVQFRDRFEDGTPAHPYINSSEFKLAVEKHDVEINVKSGADQRINRTGEDWNVVTRLNDTDRNQLVNSGLCLLKVNSSDGIVTNSVKVPENNFCNFTSSNFDYKVGKADWFVEYEGGEYFKTNSTQEKNITFVGSYKLGDTNVEDKVYRSSLHPNSKLDFSVTDITDVKLSKTRTPKLNISIGTRSFQERDTTKTGAVFNGSNAFNVFITESVGDAELKLEFYNGSDKLFNEKTFTDTFEIFGIINSTLETQNRDSSNNQIVRSVNDTINLTVQTKTRRPNDPENISADVTFETPNGSCEKIYSEGSSQTCEFNPNRSLKSGEYNWSVNISKKFYNYTEDEVNTFTVTTPIDADVNTSKGPLNRHPPSPQPNKIQINVTNITDGTNRLSDYRYFIDWDGKNRISEQVQGSSNFSDNYTIPSDQNLNLSKLKVRVEKKFYNNFSNTEDYKVLGSMNTSLSKLRSGKSKDFVYANNSAINLTTTLTDRLGNPISEANITYNTPPGSCEKNYSIQNVYKCQYNPNNTLPAGGYEWNVSVDKSLHNSTKNDSTVKIRTPIEANITTTEGPLNRHPPSPQPNKIQINVTNITDGTDKLDGTFNYIVGWSGSTEVDGIGEDSQFNYNVTIPEDQELNVSELTVGITKGKYRPLEYKERFKVRGTVNSSLSKSKDLVFAKNDRVNLTAEVEDMNGSLLSDQRVDFNKPDGKCDRRYRNGNKYTCSFNPANDSLAGKYDWNITLPNNNYTQPDKIRSNNSIKIGTNINTGEEGFTIEGEPLNRFDGSTLRENISYDISSIETNKGNLTGYNYSVEFNGESIDSENRSNKEVIRGRYNVPIDTEVGNKTFKAEVKKEGFRNLDIEKQINVKGSLNTSLGKSKKVVQATGDQVNLTANITSRSGEPITNAEVIFNRPDGSCTRNYTIGNTYKCQYNPRNDISSDNITWNVSISKRNFVFEQDVEEKIFVTQGIEAD
ncbi:hypothetical protein GLT81_00655, partial [Nanohaloarchaea archaeon]|nr:hypothetical protein [Candidatus Nanohaloarchaea archaeon]